MKHKLLSAFPVPRFLEMSSVGLDISDSSIKFVEFKKEKNELRLGRFGDVRIQEGIVVSGDIKKPSALSEILKKLKQEYGFLFVRASLPEEKGYLFELRLPMIKKAEDIRNSIRLKLEENVPISPADAIFDYDIATTTTADHVDVVVSVFAKTDIESYLAIFKEAGLFPLSFEIEAQAIVRSVVPKGDTKTYMVVDIGRSRSGISIVKGGVVRFTTTSMVGGDLFTKAIKKENQALSESEIATLKNTNGLREGWVEKALEPFLIQLRDEIVKYKVYWATHGKGEHERVVDEVLLCGGNSNLFGLPEYLSSVLKTPTKRANVWANTFSLDKYIPDILFRDSLTYASAIGLALHELT